MEPFVTRIGDVTIERVVPKSGPGSGGGTFGKEAKDPLPAPSVSLAKRDLDGGETISVSEDLQIFLKPPLSGTDKASTGGLKHDGRKSRDSSISGSRETSHGRGDDRMAASGTDDSDASESGDDEDHHDENMDEEDEMLPQALDKTDASDLQQRSKSDEQSDVMSNSKVPVGNTVDAHSKSAALQNSIETGAVSLEPVRTEQDKPRGDSAMGGSSASDGKKVVEEGTGKMEEDSERGTSGSDANKRKAQVDAGVMHKKKKTSLSGKDGKDKGDSSSSDSEDGKEDSKSSVMERKLTNMRRNIREVMSESQLDEETLAAQRQEMERLRRVQEQQRIIREVQRQIALNRQNNKTQTRVISLLQGNSSLLKQIPSTSSSGSSGSTQVRLPNTVLVKLASGSGQGSASGAQTNKKVFELLRVQKGSTGSVPRPAGRSSAISRTVLAKPRGIGPQVHMMTPSVSIAPVISSPRLPPPSESESEGEEDSEREMLARAAALRKVAGKGKGKGILPPIIRSSVTAVAASGFTFVSW